MMAYQRSMSYAINKDPPPPSSFIGNSISTPLSGTKWKKNLARLSRKWNPASRHASSLSGTAAAAATEKLIRRPKTTIQTEDLTASQFASMAGIKIKRGRNHQDIDTSPHMGLGEYEETDDDTEDDDYDHDYSDDDLDSDSNTHGMLALSLNQRQLRQLTTKVTKAHPGSVPGMTSYSSLSSSATTKTIATPRSHPIWDVRFWQHQSQQQQHQQQKHQQPSTKHQPKQKQPKDLSGDSKQQQQQQQRQPVEEKLGTSSLSSTERSSDLSAKDTLSSGSSSLDTFLFASLPSTKPRVLHKGRFQIVLGDDDTGKQFSEPLVRTISSDSNNNVVEWHRKRAMTQ